jgi:hypothetical protein
MSYRTDQWFNLEAAGESVVRADELVSRDFIAADNQDFIYPARKVRVVNPADPNGPRNVVDLKRGYIRSLQTEENKMGLPPRKCQFQFNPQFLVQNISQNTSILNFLQTDPAQYAQPIPGNVSFSFELFFDRSMELNNWKPTDSFDTSSPWEKSSPSVVGVLHDIAAFYSVVGVGLSDAMGQYASKVLERNITNEINRQVLSQSDDDEESTYDADSEYASATAASSDFLKYNAGNTAFLLPLPVRIVFSSLYIVEGLVKDVTVTFTKFTASMVPMQCTLNVLFEAKYIGFAKKDTFFTNVLQDYEDASLNQGSYTGEATQQDIRSYYEAVAQDLFKVVIAPVRQLGDQVGNDNYVYSYSPTLSVGGASNIGPYLNRLVSNQDPLGDFKIEDKAIMLKVGFPLAKTKSRIVEELVQKSNKTVSMSVTATAELWRYTESFKQENSSLFSELAIALGANNIVVVGQPLLNIAPTGSTIPTYPDPVKAVCKKILTNLRGWNSSPGNIYQEQLPDQGGNLRNFRTVQKLWTTRINDDTVMFPTSGKSGTAVEVLATASGADKLLDMFQTGITSKKTGLPNEFTFYDRAVRVSDIQPGNQFPNQSSSGTFYYIIEYVVDITLEIDGYPISGKSIDYLAPTFKGVGATQGNSGAVSTYKTMTFTWDYTSDENYEDARAGSGVLDQSGAQTNAITFTGDYVGVF